MRLTDDQVRKIADEVLGKELAGYGYDHADAASALDWDGEPSLVVTAVLKLEGALIPGAILSRAHQVLNDELKLGGEERFPLLRPLWLGEVIPETSVSDGSQ